MADLKLIMKLLVKTISELDICTLVNFEDYLQSSKKQLGNCKNEF